MSKYTPQETTQTVLSDASTCKSGPTHTSKPRSTQPAARVGGLFSSDIPRGGLYSSTATSTIDPSTYYVQGGQRVAGHKSGSIGGPKFRQSVST